MRNFFKNSPQNHPPLFRDVLGLSLLAPERRRQTVLSERGFVVLLFAMRRSRFFFFFFDDIREQRKGSILFNRIPRDDEEEI